MKLLKYLLLIISIFSILMTSFAYSEPMSEIEENCNKDKDCLITSYRQKIVTLDKEVDQLSEFNSYKNNYLQLYTISPDDEDKGVPSADSNVKFQFSIKKRLSHFDSGNLFMGYSQKSFWRMYDAADSRPFRESNYNPELFFRVKEEPAEYFWGADIGAEHESNGQIEPLSRSWNRLYVKPKVEVDLLDGWYFVGALKAWYRWPDPPKDSSDDTGGDENPDIHKFYGYGELYLDIKYKDVQLSFMGRQNPKTKKGAVQIDFTWPALYLEEAYWHLQYFNGYGESLIHYNKQILRYGIGIMFAR